MLILGHSEDLFDAGASLTDGEQVLFASNEERCTRGRKAPTPSSARGWTLSR